MNAKMRPHRLYVRPRRIRRALWLARDIAFLVADRIWLGLLRLRRASGPAPARPKLVIIAAHGLGDFVLFLDTFAAILRLYPQSAHHVTLVCSSTVRDFAVLDCAPDAVIQIDRVRLRRDLPYRLRILSDLARGGFAIALQASFNRDLLVEDCLIRATGAPIRIGSAGTPMFIGGWARRLGERWYTRLVAAAHRPMHELERNAEFIRELGGGTLEISPPRLCTPPRPPTIPAVPYLLFAVGSSSPLKGWPLKRFEAIAHAVAERAARPIVFSAGPADRIERTDFRHWDEDRFLDRLGGTSLAELLALVAHATLVVSNDSAVAHLAAAFGTPALCILGGGIVGRYHPYPPSADGRQAPMPIMVPEPMACFDCGWRCIHDVRPGDPAPCIARIDEKRVLDAVLDRLDQLRATDCHAGGAADANTRS